METISTNEEQKDKLVLWKWNLLVAITKTSKLLLASSIPAVKADTPTVGKEVKRMHFHTNSGCKTALKAR
jgi:hypothetical protein